MPGDDIVTATQNLDNGVCLIVGNSCINTNFSARFAAVVLEPLTEDAGCIVFSVALPNHHNAAIGKAGDGRAILVVLSGGRDACLCTDLCPAGLIALQVTAPAAAVLTVRSPGHHKTAVFKRGDLRAVLHADSGCVDDKLTSNLDAIGVVDLGGDVRHIVESTRLPSDHVATVGQCGNGGIFLCAASNAVDEGWSAYLHATGVIALGVDVIGGACSLIAPCHDVTSIIQSRE